MATWQHGDNAVLENGCESSKLARCVCLLCRVSQYLDCRRLGGGKRAAPQVHSCWGAGADAVGVAVAVVRDHVLIAAKYRALVM